MKILEFPLKYKDDEKFSFNTLFLKIENFDAKRKFLELNFASIA